MTAEEKRQVAEFTKQVQLQTLKAIEAQGYEIVATENGLEITKKGAPTKEPTEKRPSVDDIFAGYAADMRALYAKEGLEPPTDKELKASFVKDKHRIQSISAFTQSKIEEQVGKALDTVMKRFDTEDRGRWYSGERAFLKEMEGDIDKLLDGKGSAKDIDKLVKAAMKREREKILSEKTGQELRHKLGIEGHMESGGRRGGDSTPSVSTIQKQQKLLNEIETAAKAGKTDDMNELIRKYRRPYHDAE
jgi:hypothetical protein